AHKRAPALVSRACLALATCVVGEFSPAAHDLFPASRFSPPHPTPPPPRLPMPPTRPVPAEFHGRLAEDGVLEVLAEGTGDFVGGSQDAADTLDAVMPEVKLAAIPAATGPGGLPCDNGPAAPADYVRARIQAFSLDLVPLDSSQCAPASSLTLQCAGVAHMYM